jgi:hypothetical protein
MNTQSKLLVYPLLVVASMQLFGQATSPMNRSMTIPTEVQQNYPGSPQVQQNQPVTNGKFPIGGYSVLQSDSSFCRALSSGPDETSIRLDAAREMLALLMTPSDLKQLIDSEDLTFGASDSIEKLNHRKNVLSTIVNQLKGVHE